MILKGKLKWLKILLPIFLGVFLIYYSFLQVSFSQILSYFKSADLFYVFLGLILMFLSHLSRAYRWVVMLNGIGYKIKLSNSVMALFSAYLVNYIFPRAGELARASIISNYERIPFNKSMGTIISERVADVVMLLLVILIALLSEFDILINFLKSQFSPVKLIVMVSFLLVGLAGGTIYYKKIKKNASNKLVNFLNGLIEGVLSVVTMKAKKTFVFHTFVIWALYVLMFYVTIFSFTELESLSIGAVLVAFIMASFSIAATNGGIGSYPLAIFAAFSLYGISKEPSIAFGWIVWGAQTIMIIILGGLSLLVQPIINRKNNY